MSEIKIGDRVHARFPYCKGAEIGTVTAIERSAGATVYNVLLDEAETPSRTTAAWLVEVTTESGTAENLRAALARCTEERDKSRMDRDYWTLLASQHLEWGRGLERERNEARKKLEGSLAREESLKISREEALVKRDALAKERAEVAKECRMSSHGHDELRRWREQGRAPAGSCPFCASRICVIERDGVFVARCSHRGCGARGPRHHDLTRACDLFCCPPRRTAGGMGGPDVGGAL